MSQSTDMSTTVIKLREKAYGKDSMDRVESAKKDLKTTLSDSILNTEIMSHFASVGLYPDVLCKDIEDIPDKLCTDLVDRFFHLASTSDVSTKEGYLKFLDGFIHKPWSNPESRISSFIDIHEDILQEDIILGRVTTFAETNLISGDDPKEIPEEELVDNSNNDTLKKASMDWGALSSNFATVRTNKVSGIYVNMGRFLSDWITSIFNISSKDIYLEVGHEITKVVSEGDLFNEANQDSSTKDTSDSDTQKRWDWENNLYHNFIITSPFHISDDTSVREIAVVHVGTGISVHSRTIRQGMTSENICIEILILTIELIIQLFLASYSRFSAIITDAVGFLPRTTSSRLCPYKFKTADARDSVGRLPLNKILDLCSYRETEYKILHHWRRSWLDFSDVVKEVNSSTTVKSLSTNAKTLHHDLKLSNSTLLNYAIPSKSSKSKDGAFLKSSEYFDLKTMNSSDKVLGQSIVDNLTEFCKESLNQAASIDTKLDNTVEIPIINLSTVIHMMMESKCEALTNNEYSKLYKELESENQEMILKHTEIIFPVKLIRMELKRTLKEHRGYIEDDEIFIPKIDDNYVMRKNPDSILEAVSSVDEIPFMFGEFGTGKSKSAEQLAARLGIPYLAIVMDGSVAIRDAVGHMTINKFKEVVFKEALLVKYLQMPSVIVFEEIPAAPPSMGMMLHELFEKKEFYSIDSGKRYKKHTNCTMICTGNPQTSGYTGLQKMNIALVSRLTPIEVKQFDFNTLFIRESETFGISKREIISFIEKMNKNLKDRASKIRLGIRNIRQWNKLVETVDNKDTLLTKNDVVESAFLTGIKYVEPDVYDESYTLAKTLFGLVHEEGGD